MPVWEKPARARRFTMFNRLQKQWESLPIQMD